MVVISLLNTDSKSRRNKTLIEMLQGASGSLLGSQVSLYYNFCVLFTNKSHGNYRLGFQKVSIVVVLLPFYQGALGSITAKIGLQSIHASVSVFLSSCPWKTYLQDYKLPRGWAEPCAWDIKELTKYLITLLKNA